MAYLTEFYTQGVGGGGGEQLEYVMREYNLNATWNKPTSNLLGVEVFICGAGGGGASGSVAGTSLVARAGSGGGGAGQTWTFIPAADLNTTEAIVVGAGGAGGSPVTANDTVGNSGSAGGTTSFGTHVIVTGSGGGTYSTGGLAGFWWIDFTPAANPNTWVPFIGEGSSSVGGAGSALETQSAFTPHDMPHASDGGGVRTTNQAYEGGVGTALLSKSLTLDVPAAAKGTAGGGHGGDGVSNVMTFLMAGSYAESIDKVGTFCFGQSGGGGGGNATGNGGNAGRTGEYGSGGSGGGACRNGFQSGAGAAGGQGFVKVLEIYYL